MGAPAISYNLQMAVPEQLRRRAAAVLVGACAFLLPAAELWAAAPPARPGGALVGRILDPAGRPVDRAQILVLQSLESRWDPEEGLETSSSFDGRFRAPDPGRGEVKLAVFAKGLAAALFEGIRAPDDDRELDLGDLRLEAGVPVRGRILDPEGKPIAGAHLSPLAFDDPRLGQLLAIHGRRHGSRQSDGDGRFALPDLPSGASLVLVLDRKGYISRRSPLRVSADLGELELEMRPALLLQGRVVEPSGAAVEGAEVRATTYHPGDFGSTRTGHGSARSGPAGNFEMYLEGGGTASLRASHGLRLSGATEIALGATAPDSPLLLVLGEETVVEGIVVDGSARPRGGVSIRLEGREGSRLSQALTGPDGRFRLAALPGSLAVVAQGEDGSALRQRVEVAAGAREDLRLVLEAETPNIAGRLLDPAGQPLPNTRFRLVVQGGPILFGGGASHTTDGRGGFFLRAPVEGGEVLVFQVEGHPDERLAVSPEALPLEGVEIRLRAGTTVVGRISGLSRQRLREVRVSAYPTAGNLNLSSYRGEVLADGSFEIRGLGAGSWTVRGQVRSVGRRAELPVEIAAGEDRIRAPLRFPEGLTLAGRLLREGRGAPGEHVHLRDPAIPSSAAETATVSTDFRGRFRIEGLEAGDYVLVTRFGARPLSLTTDREEDFDFEATAGETSPLVLR